MKLQSRGTASGRTRRRSTPRRPPPASCCRGGCKPPWLEAPSGRVGQRPSAENGLWGCLRLIFPFEMNSQLTMGTFQLEWAAGKELWLQFGYRHGGGGVIRESVMVVRGDCRR